MVNFRPLTLSAFLIFLTPLLFAQSLTPESAREKVLTELKSAAAEHGLQPADYAEFRMTDFYTSRQNGLTYFYLQQTHQGVPVERGTANGVFDASGELRHFNLRFFPQLQQRLGPDVPGLDAQNALKFAAQALDIPLPASSVRVLEEKNDERQTTIFDEKGIALEPVEVRLTWFPADGESLRLCWEVHWYETDANHRWVLFLDAQDGKVWKKYDLVLNCNFGSPEHAHTHECLGYDMRGFEQSRRSLQVVNEPNTYRVFPVPVESPNHGTSALVTDPADTLASPFGWHDTDGQPGAEYTITRGNNVHAYQDSGNFNESSGDEPDGGPDLIFDFPYDPNDLPEEYQDAAVTNLFYWCNVVHNVWYNYGFDEEAGNFQENNFGRGGVEGDYIRAEAQDGSGTNNANFSSAADGTSARIQMYLWTSQSNSFYLEVLEPDTIAGLIQTASASFGPNIPQTPLTGELVQAVDDSANPTQACEGVTNASEVEGKIALIDRGNCTFVEKVVSAQEAGAIAVIICNNQAGPPTTMGGVDVGIDIPSVMISQNDCAVIKGFLNEGVTVKLQDDNSGTDFLDGDFDNGIIAHEYGHGLSIRMTGGPSTGSCLFNDEQMGEGWSDYAGLVLTMEEGDQGGDIRGIGTFAINQSTTGNGIRPAPYSTDFNVNPFTYGNSNNTNISQPHGVGFIWATALWEMTWDFIDLYGFDSDFSHGEGGNNIAIRLVTEGMRLQACNPGMVDGRDAILAADELLYDGIHKCLIWEAFARRGLGFSASQGSPFDRFDQVEAFDIPTICQTPITEPTALFSPNVEANCTGDFQFTDESTDIPQSWFWDFGDGNTSDEQNPSHTYTQEGTYEVILTVTNTLGESTYSLMVEVDFPDAPQADDQVICAGESTTLEASGPGEVNWYQNGQLLFTGGTFETGPLSSSQTYEMETEILAPSENVGPEDNNFGTGGYHNTGFTGIIYFTAHTPLVIETVWVDAGNAGDRTIVLFDGTGGIVDEVNVFIPEGQSTITLNLEVPTAGDYGLGGTSVNLYRNSSGATYPYELDGMLTMTGTSANTADDYYYYFYDWKVREVSCFSEAATVSVEVNPAPEAGFTFEQVDENIEFTDASTGAVSWSWDFGDGNTSTEQNPSHEYAQTGDYTVTLIIDNGNCTDTLVQTVSYSTVVATQDISGLEYFRLLPNPGIGLFRVQAQLDEARPVSLRITNALGKVVYSREAQQTQQMDESIDLRQLPAGAYLISLISEGQVAVRQYVLVK